MPLPSWYEYPDTESTRQIRDYYDRLKKNLEKNKEVGFAAYGLKNVEALGGGWYRLSFFDGQATEVQLKEISE